MVSGRVPPFKVRVIREMLMNNIYCMDKGSAVRIKIIDEIVTQKEFQSIFQSVDGEVEGKLM